MAEPTSTGGISLTVISIAALGPVAGPYTVILFSSLAGALWPLSNSEAMTRKAGALLLLRCMLTAVILTVALSNWLQQAYGIQAVENFAPVAFVIGALGNGWRPVFDAVGAAFQRILGGGK